MLAASALPRGPGHVKLPGAERAVISEAKVRDYLLSESHPIGRFKAAFFRALGYSAGAWPQLERDLREQARQGEAVPTEATPYGQKYEISATLVGPLGREAIVVSVWIVLREEDFPRLVTVFPG